MGPGQVVHEHPEHLDQPLARLVPVASPADHLDGATAAAVPGHLEPLAIGGRRPRPPRGWAGGALLARAAVRLAHDHRRRLVQGRVGVEQAHQRRVAPPTPDDEPAPGHASRTRRRRRRRIAGRGTSESGSTAVAASVPRASCAAAATTPRPSPSAAFLGPGRGLATSPLLGPGLGLVLGLLAPGLGGRGLGFRGLLPGCDRAPSRPAAPRAGSRRGTGPGSPGRPICAPSGRRCRNGSSRPGRGDSPCHRPGTAVLVNRIVAGQEDGPIGDPMIEDEAGQDPRQGESGPASLGEDAVEAGGIAVGQAGGRAEEVGDGAASGGQDGGEDQDEKALVGGMVEDRGE